MCLAYSGCGRVQGIWWGAAIGMVEWQRAREGWLVSNIGTQIYIAYMWCNRVQQGGCSGVHRSVVEQREGKGGQGRGGVVGQQHQKESLCGLPMVRQRAKHAEGHDRVWEGAMGKFG